MSRVRTRVRVVNGKGDSVYKTIVVGFHKSSSAREAVRHAAGLASAVGADLHLVAAVPEGSGADQARHAAEAALESYQLGTAKSVQTHAVPGDPAKAICQVATDVGADLVVVGNKGLKESRRSMSSVAGAVSHEAPCAVLIAHTT